ncbi:MAG: hypothetical protein ABIH72_00580 [archaeon]
MNKRGQFYIVAAVIIIIALISLVSITNYVRNQNKETKIYDLSKEVGDETGEVYSYGIYNEEDTQLLIRSWLNEYVNYANNYGPSDWLFVYGNSDNITALTFTNYTVGSIILDFGGSAQIYTLDETRSQGQSFIPFGDYVNVTFFNYAYDFELKKGENFYFVIRKEGVVERG